MYPSQRGCFLLKSVGFHLRILGGTEIDGNLLGLGSCFDCSICGFVPWGDLCVIFVIFVVLWPWWLLNLVLQFFLWLHCKRGCVQSIPFWRLKMHPCKVKSTSKSSAFYSFFSFASGSYIMTRVAYCYPSLFLNQSTPLKGRRNRAASFARGGLEVFQFCEINLRWCGGNCRGQHV